MRLLRLSLGGRKTAPAKGRGRRGTRRSARRRRPLLPAWLTWRRGAAVAAVLSVAGGAWWLHETRAVERAAAAMNEKLLAWSGEAGLRVDEVLIEGRTRSTPEAILAALDVARGTPILAIDPDAARAKLEALPWIASAAIERRLPNVLYLRVVEREPMALWQLDGQIRLIDHGGAVIPDVDPRRFADLPLVVGPDAPRHARALIRLLAREPELESLVVAAVRIGGRRWNLRLDSGVDVRLPEGEIDKAWTQFARIQREHDLLGRDVSVIDLRLPDRLIVRTVPASAPGADDDGENT